MASKRHRKPFAWILAIACAVPVLAVQAPEGDFPPDFDLRPVPDAGALDAARRQAAAAFEARFGDDAVLHWGDLSDRPQMILRPRTLLAHVPGGDPVDAVRTFLRAGRGAFGLTDDEVDGLDAAKVYTTNDTGVTHVQFLQRVDGISVFRGQVRVNLTEAGGVVNVGGEFFPGLRVDGPPKLSAAEALAVAARGIGMSGTVPAPTDASPDGDRLTSFPAGGEFLDPSRVRLVLLPHGGAASQLTWEVVLTEGVSGRDHMYRVLVDARTGEAVFRERMTLYMGDPATAEGLVFDETPIAGPQELRSFAGDPVASPSFWIEDGQQLTKGNNVASRTDWTSNNTSSDDNAADGGRRLEFDFPFTNSYEETGNVFDDSDAAITNAFHLGNVIHDHWWHLGFDEAAGNYQQDNFGLGGVGGDRVNIDVQDGAQFSFFRNNANWNPTLDGTQPRTNFFIWTDPPWTRRDGAFDGTVIWHEFGHGLSTRLVGGPSTQCLGGAQGGGMGEGWSDWVAIDYYNHEADGPDGPVVVGEYVTGRSDIGIRRVPYAHDMGVSPLTYEDLCDNGSCSVHDEGEIWASTLWDVRHDLIEANGYAEGRDRAQRLVIDGMKLSPCSPNFIVMRDAILQADDQRYASANVCLIRQAFARRGMGALATSTGTGSNATADFSKVAPPSDSLQWNDPATLAWAADAGAVAYDVSRGSFVADLASNAFDDATCFGETSGTQLADAEVPAPGTGFYYVRSVQDACFESTFGAGSSGADRVAGTCP